MLLFDRFKSQGDVLFRNRGHLPYLLLPLLAVAMVEAGGQFQSTFGKPAEMSVEIISALIALSGAAVRIATVGFVPAGTSGRNTHGQRADQLNTTGLYSVVRNPLYLGNFLVLLGFSLATQVWWFALIACLVFALYYERIIATEENYLLAKFGDDYEEWARRTPAFVPRLSLWQKPAFPFSLRTVVRREYNGVFLVVVWIVAMEIIHDLAVGDATLTSWPADWSIYLTALGLSAIIYLITRHIKHATHMLEVEHRS